jgi:hypothetical protein
MDRLVRHDPRAEVAMSGHGEDMDADPVGHSGSRLFSHPAAVLVLCMVAFLPIWGVKRLFAWTEMRSHPEQAMKWSETFLGAAVAPLAVFPWSYDEDCRSVFLKGEDPFAPWPIECRGTTLREMPPLEPGIVFPLAIAARIFWIPPSLVVLAGIQLGLDAAVLLAICWLALQFGGPVAAIAAGWLYSVSPALSRASTFPFYYYWPIPIAVALVATLLTLSRSRSAGAVLAWGGLAGALAATGCWFRGTMVTVALVTPILVFVLSRASERSLRAALVSFFVIIVVLLPSAWHNLPRSGSILPRRQVWHDLFIGIGTRPNPYGIVHSDKYGTRVAAERYGVIYHKPGYEEAMRAEYLAVLRANPLLILGNFARNTWDSLRGVSMTGPIRGHALFPWLTVAGVTCLFVMRRGVARPAAACAFLWLVQCATLGLVKWPQESYLWETLALGILCGAFGLGAVVESIGFGIRRGVRMCAPRLDKASLRHG